MRFLKLVALFMVASIIFISCNSKKEKGAKETTTENENTGGNPKDLIVNTWKPMSAGENDAVSDSAMQLLEGSTYQFTSDGKYIIAGLTPEPIEMNYTMSDDGKTITLSGSGQTDMIVINKLQADVLILTTSAGERVTYSPK